MRAPFFVVFCGFLFIQQFLQLVLGLSPLAAGMWTLPWALSFILGTNVTPVIVRRVRPASLMAAGSSAPSQPKDEELRRSGIGWPPSQPKDQDLNPEVEPLRGSVRDHRGPS